MGDFVLGDPSPPRDILFLTAVPAFQATQTTDRWINTYESTNGCFAACVREGACHSLDVFPTYVVPNDPTSGDIWAQDEYANRAANLTFPGAERFCEWLGGRVVNEAEWMRMARGDDGRVLPWATGPFDPFDPDALPGEPGLMEVVGASWRPEFDLQVEDVGENPTDVGPFGHHGVAGLSAEWTRDAALPYEVSDYTDPFAAVPPNCEDCIWRVVVGNWFTTDPTPDIRSRGYGVTTDFSDGSPIDISGHVGYSTRCVFDQPPPPYCRPE